MAADRDWSPFDAIDVEAAAERLRGVVRRTPLLPFAVDDDRIELRLKLENRQETGAFKARGAWNQVAQLTEAERCAGVVASSSGNHGGALAWAARRAGVAATIVMPESSYPNKIAACRERGAEVVLTPTREEAEAETERRVALGATLVHPYDAARTIQGAGTVGLEIAEDLPDVEVVLFPVGGGGLIAGSSLALRRRLGDRVTILGVEPAGAPSMRLGLEAGGPVLLESITTDVQGLCPLSSGELNVAICAQTLDGVELLEDEVIFAAQRRLVAAGETVEPAGAAAAALVLSGRLEAALPAELLPGRGPRNPLRVVAVISGGNPDPGQLVRLRTGP